MNYTYSFEKLQVWQIARTLVKSVYIITKQFPDEEKFGLISQLRRAAVSIVSNLAEGSGKSSMKDQIRYVEIAYSSTLEVYCQLMIASDLDYVNEHDLESFKKEIVKITNMLNSLKKSMQDRL